MRIHWLPIYSSRGEVNFTFNFEEGGEKEIEDVN